MISFKQLISEVEKNLGFLSIVLLLFFIPYLIGKAYTVSILSIILIWAILALSYDLLLGHAGILSFGHAAPFGVAAYVTAILLLMGFPFLFSMTIAILSAGAINLFMGIPVKKVRGVYYAILTLAIAETIRISVDNFARYAGTSVSLIPGYPRFIFSEVFFYFCIIISFVLLALVTYAIYDKIKSKARRDLFFYASISPYLLILIFTVIGIIKMLYGNRLVIITINFYYLSLITFALSYYLIKLIIRSPMGSVWRAIRDNPIRAETIGYDTYKYSLYALFISGVFAGVAGSLFALTTVVSPDSVLSATITLLVLLSVILGGISTLIGPVIGTFIVQYLRYSLSTIPMLSYLSMAILGMIYIIVVIAFPYGIMGTWYLKAIGLRRKIRRKLIMILSSR